MFRVRHSRGTMTMDGTKIECFVGCHGYNQHFPVSFILQQTMDDFSLDVDSTGIDVTRLVRECWDSFHSERRCLEIHNFVTVSNISLPVPCISSTAYFHIIKRVTTGRKIS
mmetsp:Transcript_11596/g.22068  ORF Transcript_11596/g.22068 Transcript_11596/m.22068 type:complete len:111 (-) Transcript_11596:60-392(-)